MAATAGEAGDAAHSPCTLGTCPPPRRRTWMRFRRWQLKKTPRLKCSPTKYRRGTRRRVATARPTPQLPRSAADPGARPQHLRRRHRRFRQNPVVPGCRWKRPLSTTTPPIQTEAPWWLLVHLASAGVYIGVRRPRRTPPAAAAHHPIIILFSLYSVISIKSGQMRKRSV